MSWQTVKLGDVCDVRDGTHDSPKFIESGFALITSKNLINGKIDKLNVSYISESDFININKRSKVDCGDILMAMIGTIGNPVIVTDEIPNFAIKNVALLKFNNDLLDRFFIKQLLQSSIFNNYIAQTSKGGTQKFLSLGDIRKFPIPLPPISEQKRIAAILDKADEIRRKREQAIAKLEQLAQSIFVEMFGDPVTNQKGWKLKKWDDVLKIINGKNQKNVLTINGAYPIFGSGGNEMGRANDFLCNENTIIIGRKGNINKPILIKEKFWNVDTAFGLHAKKEILSFQYLYWFCVFFNFEKLNKTVTIPSLTKSDLLQIQIPLPPIAFQEEFAKRINQIEKLKADNTMALANHNALFASLQQQAFSGNL